MRVTNQMISNRVLYNLTRSTSRYLGLQTIASSGRRINSPSDDPLGITKDLSFRSRLSDISQFNLNVTYAKSWLGYSDQAMDDINGLITEAKDLAIQLGNDTYDESARTAAAAQAREIFNQIMDAANTQYQGKYIFSGSRTNMAAMVANATGVQYQGDYQDILTETERDSFLRLNTFGSEFLTQRVTTLGAGFDLNPGIQPSLWLSNLNNGNGIAMGGGQIVVNTLNGSFNVDIGAANPTNVQQMLDAINAAGIPNFNVSIGEAGSGFQFEDTSDHHLTGDTPLSMLNRGEGIQQIPGTFTIRTSDGSLTANIDISGATNLDDVLTEINNELAAAGINNVTASIHPTENKLVLTDTNAAPYNLVVEDIGNATTAEDLGLKGEMLGEYVGKDLEPMHIQVQEAAPGESLAESLGLLKSTEFDALVGEDVNPKLTYNTLLSSLNSNSGLELGVIRISNGHQAVNIDLRPLAADPNATLLDLVDKINHAGIDARAVINEDGTGIAVTSKYDDRTFMVTDADGGRTSSALGIFGSSDLLGNVLVLEKALENNDVEQINSLLDTFNSSLDKLLTVRSSVGSREIRAESSGSRLLSQELLVTEQLSQVEDADMLKVISELATAETMYNAALASAAKVIQPTLMDFLR
jgi:flagellin-like hook-associated protein FlgL